MKTLFLCLALCLLVACNTAPKADEYVTRTEYVTVPCEVDKPRRPAWAVDALPIGAEIDQQMQALRADRQLAKGYILLLEAAIDGCRATAVPITDRPAAGRGASRSSP